MRLKDNKTEKRVEFKKNRFMERVLWHLQCI